MRAGRPSSTPPTAGGTADDGRPVLSARAGAALGVLVVLVAILAIPSKEWVTQRARIADLEEQLAWHHDRVDQLTATLERWEDPAYVEAQARARLRFVRVGEVGYVVLTDEATQSPETTQTRPMAQVPKGGPWWSALWSTVYSVATADPGSPAPRAPAPAQPAETYGE